MKICLTEQDTAVALAPSLICVDQCRLAREVMALDTLNVDFLHVDLIDGHFSPSMPLGIEAVRQLKPRTDLPFDVHLMVTEHDFFIDEMIDIGVERLCFHYESAGHVDRLLEKLHGNGICSGIALKPATPLRVLEYCLDRIDYVLLMLINPGFASHPGVTQVPYARQRVAKCRKFLDERGFDEVAIEIDGRVSFANIPDLVGAGADVLVAGTQSLFHRDGSLEENLAAMHCAVAKGLQLRKREGL
ncbi:MAG: ribulose-phosphate 3-epimerase [Methylohalobius crimeensis]